MQSKEYIPGPVVEIDVTRARRNIRRMQAKALRSDAILRPHFKTHQSLEVAKWFREEGINRCTVSSPAMAEVFAAGGWGDILIAFPAQPGALDVYHRLASQITLGIIGDSIELLDVLDERLEKSLDFWVELDTGYGRTGIRWDDGGRLETLATRAEACCHLNFRGLMSHAGNSYGCRGRDEVVSVFEQASTRMQSAAAVVKNAIGRSPELSFGDTPTCSVCDDFSMFDELRPGNFVFYDLMQRDIGACLEDDIALTLLCPVVGIYPERGELVIHGGAVHFSKDALADGSFGRLIESGMDGKLKVLQGPILSSLSQEHGVISVPNQQMDWLKTIRIGSVVRVVPVHSCLTMGCMINRPNAIRYMD